MTYSDTQPRGTLCYELLSASLHPKDSPLADPSTWEHEYIRHLAAELVDEFQVREAIEVEDEPDENTPKPVAGTIDELRALGRECAIFLLAYNAEPDAVDLLEEMEMTSKIVKLVDDNPYARVCQYMLRYVSHPFIQSAYSSLVVHPSSHLQMTSSSFEQPTKFTSNIPNSPKQWLSQSNSMILSSSNQISTRQPTH